MALAEVSELKSPVKSWVPAKKQLLINGKWVDAKNGKTFDVENPATGDIVAKVADGKKEDIDEAVKAARKAFETGPWKDMSASERGKIVWKIGDLILKYADELAELESLDNGKPLAVAGAADVPLSADLFHYMAGWATKIKGDTFQISTDHFYTPGQKYFTYTLKEPVGVVGQIIPWNFPLLMAAWKLGPVLATGNTVVLKPAEQTPLSALRLAEIIQEAGVPDGVLNVVTGDGEGAGAPLAAHDGVDKVAFTGSTEVGKILLKQSASTVKKVSMELGGHAPFIVFDDANIDEAVKGAMQSKFRNSGQTCICANRIFVHEKIYDEFLNKFTNEVNKIKVGNGLNEGVVSGPLIDINSLNKVLDHVNDAVSNGAKIAVGGEIHSLGGNFFQPTVLSNVNTKAKITYEETFGPVAPLYKFSSDEEVIKLANDTPYGLASYFYSRDIGRIWRVAEALEYGQVGVNTGLTTKAEIPFGGVKESGLGREGSKYGLDDYLEIKYISIAGI